MTYGECNRDDPKIPRWVGLSNEAAKMDFPGIIIDHLHRFLEQEKRHREPFTLVDLIEGKREMDSAMFAAKMLIGILAPHVIEELKQRMLEQDELHRFIPELFEENGKENYAHPHTEMCS